LGVARNESGEIDYVDYDPICAKCGYSLGDDWYEEDALKVLDNPFSTPAQKTNARIILGMPEAEAMKMEEAER